MTTALEQRALRHARSALRAVHARLPELVGLGHAAKLVASPLIPTAGVFRSGRVVVNPAWFAALDLADATFVMAHELLHLLLRTHERAEGSDRRTFNIAHDAVINDRLRQALGREPPVGAVWLPRAAELCAEEIVAKLGEHFDVIDGADPLATDVLPDELERAFGGGPHAGSSPGGWGTTRVRAERERIDLSLADRMEQVMGIQRLGSPTARGIVRVRGLEAWLTERSRGGASRRTWGRASRRGEDTLRPGRDRRGPALGVVLDTSSSMVADMDRALGALRFVISAAEDGVRLVQTDGNVCSDAPLEDWPATATVACGGDREMVVMPPCENCGVNHAYRIHGADTDLSTALERLAGDPATEAIVVLTDGYVRAPPALRTPTLWVLVQKDEEAAQLLPRGARIVVLDD